MTRETTYFEKGTPPPDFNLLYPPGAARTQENLFLELDPAAAHDLRLDQIITAFIADRQGRKELQALFHRLPLDPQVILYRQAVLDDLLANPGLADGFTSLLPLIQTLFDSSYHSSREMTWLHEVVERVGELQTLIDCFEGMGNVLGSFEGKVHSEGLRTLHAEIRKAQSDPTYKSLLQELPGLLSRLRGSASITIGVNLDANLRPIQATLLSVHEKPFTDQSLLNRLFGMRTEREGIAPLHAAPRQHPDLDGAIDPLMVPLFADLAKVLEKTAIPIADQLNQYASLHGTLFTELRDALLFYLGAIRFIRRLEAMGLPTCRPQIAPIDERRCEVKNSYNLHLALRPPEGITAQKTIVTNDIFIGAAGHILILTGPNGGGKTTYMQGVGLVHILAQLGWYVPGSDAIISPLDHLFTHFPLEEKPESNSGRFGEEAIRLGKIFEQVTRHSLVLLNESLSSTSFGESLYLAQDIVRILRRIGARAIYSTHLHELANGVEALNDSVPGDSKIVSVVISPVEPVMHANGADGSQRYKLEVRPPLGQSYAREIAARYGISYQQLENILSERGVL